LSMASRPGGGKQLSMAPPEDDSSDDDDDEEEIQAPPPQQMMRRGMGKQLRAPSPPPRDDDDDDDDDDDSDSSDESVPPVPVGSGKRLGAMSGGGKQLRRQSANVEEDEDDSSDDSDEDAPWEVAAANRGQGKMLRPTPTKKKEESDMDESSEDDDEEEEVKKPAAAAATTSAAKAPIFDDSDDESEPEPAPPKRRGRPPRAAATRASARAKTAKKVMSSDSDSDSSSSEEEMELDFETFDTQKLVQNDDDKKYLDSLPELEREAILAERFDELKKQADIKKALRENKRRDREAKKAAEGGQKKKKTPAKKKAAATKSKKAPPKKKQKVADEEEDDDSSEEEEEEEAIDTSADAAIAASLSGKRVSARNLVKKGKQFKKQAALAKIRESRASRKEVEEESESDLDYGRDSDDSDDDYEEVAKPWQKAAKKKVTQLQAAESSDESMKDMEEEDNDEPVKRTEDAEAEQEEYAKVSIPRRRLIRWCNEPYFLTAIKNFYVRIGIGRDNKTQKACYRLCKIDGIVEKDPYTFPSSEGQSAVTTHKWLLVSFGKQKREFKMLTVSDHRPTMDDVTKYVGHLKNERGSHTLLTKKKANKLRKKQDELVNNYTYTKEDIEMLVKEKKKRNKKSANIGLEKTRVAISVRAAEDNVKEVEKQLTDAEVARMEAENESSEMIADENVNELKKALEEANNNLLEAKAEQSRIMKEDEERSNKLKQNSKIQNWDKVNQRAKLANQSADFAAYKEQQAREKAEGSSEPKFDPYARRKVKPKNLWEVKGAKSDEAAEATVEEEKKEAGPLGERDDPNATKEVDKENKRDDNPDPQKQDLSAQTNQFAYDDDIMIGGDIANLAGIGVKKTTTRIRQGISLEDYQSRKAAGTL